MKTHHIKTHPKPFDAIRKGIKTFEIRVNDRDYKVGDLLILDEYNPKTGKYTGNILTREVIYILEGGQYGIETGYVAMSINP